MNDFNDTNGDNSITQKFKEIFIKMIRSVFDLRNLVRVLELFLLLIFKAVYGKQPVFTW